MTVPVFIKEVLQPDKLIVSIRYQTEGWVFILMNRNTIINEYYCVSRRLIEFHSVIESTV